MSEITLSLLWSPRLSLSHTLLQLSSGWQVFKRKPGLLRSIGCQASSSSESSRVPRVAFRPIITPPLLFLRRLTSTNSNQTIEATTTTQQAILRRNFYQPVCWPEAETADASWHTNAHTHTLSQIHKTTVGWRRLGYGINDGRTALVVCA